VLIQIAPALIVRAIHRGRSTSRKIDAARPRSLT
jgi:hypothetical protein